MTDDDVMAACLKPGDDRWAGGSRAADDEDAHRLRARDLALEPVAQHSREGRSGRVAGNSVDNGHCVGFRLARLVMKWPTLLDMAG